MQWRTAMLGAVILSGCLPLHAQTADPPLHRRAGASAMPASPDLILFDARLSTLPADASGEYLIDEAGSTVEVTLESGKISGYVTRMGDEQSDKNTPLTFFFDKVTVEEHRLSFATKKVHGIWYEFDGSIERGGAKTTRDENGYFRLAGAWTTHNDARQSQSREQVSFRSTPREISVKP